MKLLCTYVLKRGPNKGTKCLKTTTHTSSLCPKHMKETSDLSSKEKKTHPTIVHLRTSTTYHDRNQLEETLRERIISLPTSADNRSIIIKHFNNMKRVETNSTEYYKNQVFVDLCMSYPWNASFDINNILKQTDVKTFLHYVRSTLDKNIHGMDHVKNEIINIVCKFITNPNSTRNNIALYGYAGVGKSKFIKVLSETLGIPIKIISLGGVKDSSFFLGHGYVYVESGPGKILQNIIESKVSNPIIYFDELDKVSETEQGKDVQSFLSYLTDPTQNSEFTDHYFYGMKFDLSKVFYVFSFNDISKIDKVLLDRLNVIYVPTPSNNDMVLILLSHSLPEILENIGIKCHIDLSQDHMKNIISKFSKFVDLTVSSGLREYYRILEKILLEINKDILLGNLTPVEGNITISNERFDAYTQNAKNCYFEEKTTYLDHLYI